MYKLIKKDGDAKRGEFHTVHGVIQTPVFMNVGTAAAIKGAVSTEDLEGIGTQVELSNTYHLHVRPGDQVVKKMGGLHKLSLIHILASASMPAVGSSRRRISGSVSSARQTISLRFIPPDSLRTVLFRKSIRPQNSNNSSERSRIFFRGM